MSDIKQRLLDACNGHPHAQIAWPHRLLHDAHDRIAELEAELIQLRNICVRQERDAIKYCSRADEMEAKVRELEEQNAELRANLQFCGGVDWSNDALRQRAGQEEG